MAIPATTADIKFAIIGRQPELLKRFQSSESNNFVSSPSRSPSPEPSTEEIRSRPSLFESLGQHKPETNPTSALDERKPTPIQVKDLDCECSLRLQYPPTPSDPSPIFATLSAIQSRISSLCLPNTSPALLLVQSAQKRSADALDLAIRANNLAQESLNSAREAASAAQDALTAGNEAKASVTAVIKAINDIGFAENGTGSFKTQEWKESFRYLNTDLNQVSQWIIDRQAEELAMQAGKESFFAEKKAFAEQVLAYERKQREELLQRQAAEEAAKRQHEKEFLQKQAAEEAGKRQYGKEFLQKQAVEEAAKKQHETELLQKQAAEEAAKKQREEELERQDEVAREDKRKRAAERQRRSDLLKQKAEEQEARREQEREEEAKKEQERRRQEIQRMKQKSQEEEAARIRADRAKKDSQTSPPPLSPEVGPLNDHSTAGQPVSTRSPENLEHSVEKSAQRACALSPKLARSVALALCDPEVATTPPQHLPSSFPSRAMSQCADERQPLAYCLSSDKGNLPNLPIVDDDDSFLPHVQETNLFVVMQGHRDPQDHNSNGAVIASSTPPRTTVLPKPGPKAPAPQTANLPFPNLEAPLRQAATLPPAVHHSNGYAIQTPKPIPQSPCGPAQNDSLNVSTRSIPDVSKADPHDPLPMQQTRYGPTPPSQATLSLHAVPPVTTVVPTRAPRHTPPQPQPTKVASNIMPAQKTSKTGGKARKKQAAASNSPAVNVFPHTRQPDSSSLAFTAYRAPSPISPDMFGGDGGWDRFHIQDEPQPQPQPRSLRTGTTKYKAAYERSPSRHYSPGYPSPPRVPKAYSPPPAPNTYRSSPQPIAGHKRLRDEDYVQFPPAQRTRGDFDYPSTTRPSHTYYRADHMGRLADRARTPPPPRTQVEHPPPTGPSLTRQWQSHEKPDLLGRISDSHKPKPRNMDSLPLTERMQGMQGRLLTRLGR